MGGGKLTLVGDSDKITPEALIKSIEGEENRGVHAPNAGLFPLPNHGKRTFLFRGRGSAIPMWQKPMALPCIWTVRDLRTQLWREMRRLPEMTWRAGLMPSVWGNEKRIDGG